MLGLLRAITFLTAALVLGGCQHLSLPTALQQRLAAERYQAAAERYDQELRAANAELARGNLLPAFASLASAEHAFSAELRAIPFPDSAQEPARRLIADSERLEALYRQTAIQTDADKLAELLKAIGEARRASSADALQVRAALGLPAPAGP